MLTQLWQDAVGEAAPSYPRERLFEPLGMNGAVIEADETGTFLGEGFLYATAHDWARFGEFLRLAGNGTASSFCRQVLSTTCAHLCRSPMRATGPSMVADSFGWPKARGFDLPADTFMMQGRFRQVIAIIPSRKLVILRIGLTREDIGYSNARLLRSIVTARL